MKFYSFLLALLFVSCGTFTHTKQTSKQLPELGTIGVYKNYILGNDYQPKTIASLSGPIRLKMEVIKVSERTLFQRKDSIKKSTTDSTLISLEILDKISMIKEINQNKELLKYLKKGREFRLVTQATVHFSAEVLSKIKQADEVYLFQEKQKTLSIQLREKNKKTETIDFTDGTIVDFTVSDFCWGQNRRRDIEVFDLIPVGSECNEGLYQSAKKAKEKNEFKF